MHLTPSLVSSFRVPGPVDTAGHPTVQLWPNRRLVVIRRDEELLAYDVDRLRPPRPGFRRPGHVGPAAATR